MNRTPIKSKRLDNVTPKKNINKQSITEIITPIRKLKQINLKEEGPYVKIYFSPNQHEYIIERKYFSSFQESIFYTNYIVKVPENEDVYISLNDDDSFFSFIRNYIRTNHLLFGDFEINDRPKVYNILQHYNLRIPLEFKQYDINKLIENAWNNSSILLKDLNREIYSIPRSDLDILPETCLLSLHAIKKYDYDVDTKSFILPSTITNMKYIYLYITQKYLDLSSLSKQEIDSIINSFTDAYISLELSRVNKVITLQFKDSIILNHYNAVYLDKWIPNQQWKLLYIASRDGDKAHYFHKYCDNQGPTYTIIKVLNTNNYECIFGGYTSISWSSKFHSICDSKAFLFTLQNPKDMKPSQFFAKQNTNTVKHDSHCGPIFGNLTYDIYIDDNCFVSSHNVLEEDHSKKRNAFSFPKDLSVELFCNNPCISSYIGSVYKCKILDYEVFGIIQH